MTHQQSAAASSSSSSSAAERPNKPAAAVDAQAATATTADSSEADDASSSSSSSSSAARPLYKPSVTSLRLCRIQRRLAALPPPGTDADTDAQRAQLETDRVRLLAPCIDGPELVTDHAVRMRLERDAYDKQLERENTNEANALALSEMRAAVDEQLDALTDFLVWLPTHNDSVKKAHAGLADYVRGLEEEAAEGDASNVSIGVLEQHRNMLEQARMLEADADVVLARHAALVGKKPQPPAATTTTTTPTRPQPKRTTATTKTNAESLVSKAAQREARQRVYNDRRNERRRVQRQLAREQAAAVAVAAEKQKQRQSSSSSSSASAPTPTPTTPVKTRHSPSTTVPGSGRMGTRSNPSVDDNESDSDDDDSDSDDSDIIVPSKEGHAICILRPPPKPTPKTTVKPAAAKPSARSPAVTPVKPNRPPALLVIGDTDDDADVAVVAKATASGSGNGSVKRRKPDTPPVVPPKKKQQNEAEKEESAELRAMRARLVETRRDINEKTVAMISFWRKRNEANRALSDFDALADRFEANASTAKAMKDRVEEFVNRQAAAALRTHAASDPGIDRLRESVHFCASNYFRLAAEVPPLERAASVLAMDIDHKAGRVRTREEINDILGVPVSRLYSLAADVEAGDGNSISNNNNNNGGGGEGDGEGDGDGASLLVDAGVVAPVRRTRSGRTA